MRTLGRSSSFVAVGALVACTAAHAQVAPPPVAPAEPAPIGQPAVVPQPAAQIREVETPRPSRKDIRSMEAVLTQALQTGAQDLARQLKMTDPNSMFVTGTGRARGFILDGHGIFFDVDVPEMRQSVVWSTQMLELDQQRRTLLGFLASTAPDDPRRRLAEADLRRIARLMGGGPGEAMTNPTTNTQMAGPGQVRATDVTPVSDAAIGAGARAALPQAQDPNELYTDSVKAALIDVMLKFSGPLKIRDNEWLTIAASDSEGQAPGSVDEITRILISIRGRDLAAFQSGKLTRDEVMKKVEVREF